MRILVVEDNPDSRRLAKVFLSAAGHEVVEAEDGQSGWELFQAEPFRLVITDWMMPRLEGPGLISRIRSSNQTNYTYIIVLTALDDKPSLVTGLEIGADEYLTKPVDRRELLARVAAGERILNLEEKLTQARQEMEVLAMHDSLTGLFNRRAIQEYAEAELNHARRTRSPLGVALLDIDHFKAINDQYGHENGDKALRQLANILTQNLRQYDRVGRWGGEEFLIVLRDAPLPTTVAIAERIRAKVAETSMRLSNDDCLSMHVSLGVVSAPGEGSHCPTLIEIVNAADWALYQAKQAGRNRVHIFEDQKT